MGNYNPSFSGPPAQANVCRILFILFCSLNLFFNSLLFLKLGTELLVMQDILTHMYSMLNLSLIHPKFLFP